MIVAPPMVVRSGTTTTTGVTPWVVNPEWIVWVWGWLTSDPSTSQSGSRNPSDNASSTTPKAGE